MTVAVPQLLPSSAVRVVETDCRTCQELELTHSGWIERYRGLIQQRKILLVDGRVPSRSLTESLSRAETELKQAGKRLVEHRTVHAVAP